MPDVITWQDKTNYQKPQQRMREVRRLHHFIFFVKSKRMVLENEIFPESYCIKICSVPSGRLYAFEGFRSLGTNLARFFRYLFPWSSYTRAAILCVCESKQAVSSSFQRGLLNNREKEMCRRSEAISATSFRLIAVIFYV